jgi:hypothetical protein
MLYRTSGYASRKTCLQQGPTAAQTLARLDLQILRTLHSLRTTIITYKHTTRVNKKQSSNSTNKTKQGHNTTTLRDDRMDIKNAKNGAKTIKICTNESTRTYL